MLALTKSRKFWVAGLISLLNLPSSLGAQLQNRYWYTYPYANQNQKENQNVNPQKHQIQSTVDYDTELTVQQKVQKASELLHSAGLPVSELCHVSSDAFAFDPWFPRCDNLVGSLSTSESRERGLRQEGNRRLEEQEESTEPKDMNFYIYNGVMAFICVCTAALAAGLTLGLLSLDPLNLLIKMRTASSEEEKRQAASLLPIVRQHHMLLVTLLLLNSMANEALPLFLDKIVPGYLAIILSVTLVLFFGEIIPSAIFTGPQRIKIARYVYVHVQELLLLTDKFGTVSTSISISL